MKENKSWLALIKEACFLPFSKANWKRTTALIAANIVLGFVLQPIFLHGIFEIVVITTCCTILSQIFTSKK